jgi:mycoredoxin
MTFDDDPEVSEPVDDGGRTDVPVLHFFWRPGCPFCASLRFRLKRAGVTVNEINIWENSDSAGFVRSVAGGNETVPTVAVGEHALVNPSIAAVLALLEEVAPSLVPAPADAPSGFHPLAAMRGRRTHDEPCQL